nr:B3 domain-containing protein Os03g0212300-like [Aegilops tauschii subsp. strangulata]
MDGHVGDQPRKFIIGLYKPLCGHLRLPTPFVREMELEQPRPLRLHMQGCGNGGMRVNVDFPAPHVIYLRRGWKTFARAHGFSEGHVLQFELMENRLLCVKIFGCSGGRLGCCAESSTDDENSSSSGSDEVDSGDDDDGSGQGSEDSDSV